MCRSGRWREAVAGCGIDVGAVVVGPERSIVDEVDVSVRPATVLCGGRGIVEAQFRICEAAALAGKGADAVGEVVVPFVEGCLGCLSAGEAVEPIVGTHVDLAGRAGGGGEGCGCVIGGWKA